MKTTIAALCLAFSAVSAYALDCPSWLAGSETSWACPSGSAVVPVNASQRLKLAASCTPGVDCDDPPSSTPSCTPGVDCSDDATPPQRRPSNPNRGNDAPLPPNYRPRPSQPPASFPDYGSPRRYDGSVTGYWHPYTSFWNFVEQPGDWSTNVGHVTIERGGIEVGQQSVNYTAALGNDSSRAIYRLYWRYVGTDCDPNDDNECLDWSIQYGWFFDRTESKSSPSMAVDIHYSNDQPLLPWETDKLVLTYDGSRIDVDQSYTAFNYSLRGPVIDQQTGRASLELTPLSRKLRVPESDKVRLRFVTSQGQLQLEVSDLRNKFYAGEILEVAVRVKKSCGGIFCFDKVVSEKTVSMQVQDGKIVQGMIPIANTSGKYYIESWSFRRVQSQVSSGDKVYGYPSGKSTAVNY